MSAEPVTTYCPACAKTFRVPPDLVGKKIVCKGCQTHFIVQADKPGLPAAAPVAKPPAAPAPAATAAKSATSLGAVAPTPTPVVAAATTPAPAATPSADLPSIPFDDVAVPLTGGGEGEAAATFVRPKALEKVKIESKGPYMVVKLVTTGKMVHVGLENALNDYATDGWRLQEIITVAPESYAILRREGGAQPAPGAADDKGHA